MVSPTLAADCNADCTEAGEGLAVVMGLFVLSLKPVMTASKMNVELVMQTVLGQPLEHGVVMGKSVQSLEACDDGFTDACGTAMLTAPGLVRGLPVVTRRFAQKERPVMMVMPMPADLAMRPAMM